MPADGNETREPTTLEPGPEGSSPPGNAPGAFAIIRRILDEYGIRILVATHERDCSAFDLSRSLGIPIVACYRRIRALEDLGLLVPSRMTMSSAGHPIRFFRSHLRSARIVFEDGELRAQIEIAPPGSSGAPEVRLAEAFDRGPVRRKRSRAPRDLGYAFAALELVAQGGEGALDSGEARG